MKTTNKKCDIRGFRCDEVIMGKAIDKATKLGMNLSEYLRFLIIKDLENIDKKE